MNGCVRGQNVSESHTFPVELESIAHWNFINHECSAPDDLLISLASLWLERVPETHDHPDQANGVFGCLPRTALSAVALTVNAMFRRCGLMVYHGHSISTFKYSQLPVTTK